VNPTGDSDTEGDTGFGVVWCNSRWHAFYKTLVGADTPLRARNAGLDAGNSTVWSTVTDIYTAISSDLTASQPHCVNDEVFIAYVDGNGDPDANGVATAIFLAHLNISGSWVTQAVLSAPSASMPLGTNVVMSRLGDSTFVVLFRIRMPDSSWRWHWSYFSASSPFAWAPPMRMGLVSNDTVSETNPSTPQLSCGVQSCIFAYGYTNGTYNQMRYVAELRPCGDGFVDTALGEECDSTPGCSSQCQLLSAPVIPPPVRPPAAQPTTTPPPQRPLRWTFNVTAPALPSLNLETSLESEVAILVSAPSVGLDFFASSARKRVLNVQVDLVPPTQLVLDAILGNVTLQEQIIELVRSALNPPSAPNVFAPSSGAPITVPTSAIVGDSPQSQGLGSGGIIAIVFSLLAVVAIALVVFFLVRRRKQNSMANNSADAAQEPAIQPQSQETYAAMDGTGSPHQTSRAAPGQSVKVDHLDGFRQEWLIDYDDLEFCEKIGSGAFGVVHRGHYGGSEVAIKQCGLSVQEEGLVEFKREALLMLYV
jgi:hypothetical protein